jgi:hypothetical protein
MEFDFGVGSLGGVCWITDRIGTNAFTARVVVMALTELSRPSTLLW